MSTIIVRHTVEDFDVWKSYFDEHATTKAGVVSAPTVWVVEESFANSRPTHIAMG